MDSKKGVGSVNIFKIPERHLGMDKRMGIFGAGKYASDFPGDYGVYLA